MCDISEETMPKVALDRMDVILTQEQYKAVIEGLILLQRSKHLKERLHHYLFEIGNLQMALDDVEAFTDTTNPWGADEWFADWEKDNPAP